MAISKLRGEENKTLAGVRSESPRGRRPGVHWPLPFGVRGVDLQSRRFHPRSIESATGSDRRVAVVCANDPWPAPASHFFFALRQQEPPLRDRSNELSQLMVENFPPATMMPLWLITRARCCNRVFCPIN